jgi:hypothetical protein
MVLCWCPHKGDLSLSPVSPLRLLPAEDAAILGMVHAILVSTFYMFSRNQLYQELGATYFDEHRRRQLVEHLVHRLLQVSGELTTSDRDVASYFQHRGVPSEFRGLR